VLLTYKSSVSDYQNLIALSLSFFDTERVLAQLQISMFCNFIKFRNKMSYIRRGRVNCEAGLVGDCVKLDFELIVSKHLGAIINFFEIL